MFDAILLKITSVLAALFLTASLFTTYLYLGTRDELIELQTKHTQLEQDLKESQESKSKVVVGSQQDDTLNVEKETAISTLEDEKKSLLKRLDVLSKKRCITPTTNTSETPPDEKTYIAPSASWGDDIQQLLNEAYESNKRDTNPTP
jgi:flagellar biosynthesis/type III secretory pathway chaperone